MVRGQIPRKRYAFQHSLRKAGGEMMGQYTQPTRQDVVRSIVYLLIYITVIFVSAVFSFDRILVRVGGYRSCRNGTARELA
ncbi:MAG: hypothetical protein PVJ32_01300 [Anaerolineales bacterium]|jgi:hypothetical protein